MSSEPEITKQFLATRVGKTPAQFSSYYKKMIFTGRGRPLPKIDSDDAVLAYVRSTNGAIGYVSVDAVTDDVKVIRVVE
jgi:ABC-type phosphate transport system substrate-binding protein